MSIEANDSGSLFLPKIHDFFLSELLLENYMSHSEILSVSRQLGYSLEGRSFYCTLLTPVNMSQPIAVYNRMSQHQLLHDAAQSLGDFCRNASTGNFQLISSTLHREIAILASLPASTGKRAANALTTEYLSALSRWIEAYESRTGLKLRAATSAMQTGIDDIPITYKQAKELEGFMTMLNLPDRNLCYEAVVVNGWEVYNEKRLTATNHWESAFLNALERNDFHRLQELIHEMAESEFQYGRITIQTSTALLYHLLNKIRIVIDHMRPFVSPDVLDVFAQAPRILYRKSIQDVLADTDMIFANFFDHFEQPDQSRLPLWLTRMDAYITEHFDDPDLNVSTVSDHFGLCAAYAGRLYKTHFGFSVLDRINQLRIERAKELMERNTLLKDIAVMVGYENRHRMNRAFLKYVGYTPREARDGLLTAPQDETT